MKIRAQKGEDEVAELDAKAKQLETELDLTAEKLGYVSLQVCQRNLLKEGEPQTKPSKQSSHSRHEKEKLSIKLTSFVSVSE